MNQQLEAPEGFFDSPEDNNAVKTEQIEAPQGLFLTQLEIDSLERHEELMADVPTQTSFPEEELGQRDAQQSFTSPVDIALEEVNRFADSYGPARVARDLVADAFSVVGSIKGAETGANIAKSLPHPAAKVAVVAATSAVATGLSQFSGEIVESAIKQEQFDWDKAFSESEESAAWDAAGNLILPAFGRISAKALQKSGITATGAKKAAEAIFEKYGTHLTRYQATGTFGAKLMENISLIGLDLLGSVNKVTEAQVKALSSEMDIMLKSPNYADIGDKIIKVHSGANATLSDQYGAGIKAITERMPSSTLDFTGFLKWHGNLVKKEAGTQKVDKYTDANDFKAKVNAAFENNLDEVSFEQISTQLSKIGQIAMAAKAKGDKDGARYAGEIFEKLEGVMLSAAQQQGATFGTELKALRAWYKDSKSLIDSEIINKAIKKKPSEVGAFLASNPESIDAFSTFITAARKSKELKPKEANNLINDVRVGYLNKLIPEGATLNDLKSLDKKLRTKKTRELTKKVLGENMYAQLQTVLDVAGVINNRAGASGKFSLVAQSKLSQAAQTVGKTVTSGGAAVGAGYAAGAAMSVPTALAIIASPTLLGKIASKPPADIRKYKKLSAMLMAAEKAGNSSLTKAALGRFANFMDSINESENERQEAEAKKMKEAFERNR